ncbi:PREDICTED: protein SRC2 homolog [Nelumbo nucifera]|uniref:C2 domain-containing protein n=2 Tax=Nelumbo nucifera TaxID=4432 RepID=A0A822YGP7_NELNU|nr:PREDICTED: protein SRC2 homolog [Nelumbo nucifera]DAD33364.1 TPA_asm: hypothetical protein HUJ06_012215 [Nelumbo nucifera]
MERNCLEVTVVSARDLKGVRKLFKMKVYVMVVLASSDKEHFKRTPIDKEGRTNPNWNFSVTFDVENHSDVQLNEYTLTFKLFCKRKLGDKYIGEVSVPIQDLLRAASGGTDSNSPPVITRPVRLESGYTQGVLTFSCRFHEGSVVNDSGVPQPQFSGLDQSPQHSQPAPERPSLRRSLTTKVQQLVTSVAAQVIADEIMD